MNISNAEKIMKYMVIIVNVILVTLTVLGVVKTCFVGFDVDEAYAVAQSYRLSVGDHMFSEMWEPHQMSAFGSAIFMLPFLLITGGNTTGIVLYLRIVGSIIHLLIGWWFYKIAKKNFHTSYALLIMLAHVNFLPKWLVLPEFEIMQYWAVCILFLSLFTWKEKTCDLSVGTDSGKGQKEKTRKKFVRWDKADGWLVLAGAALFMAMMTYPTMILLYPVYVAGLFSLKGNKVKEKWRSVLIFTGTTFFIGVLFLIYLRSYMTVEEFLRYVSNIFMDESHGEPLAIRFKHYRKDWGIFLKEMPAFIMWAAIDTGIVGFIEFVVKKISNYMKQKKAKEADDNASREKQSFARIVLKYFLIFLILWFGVFVGEHILGSLLYDKNQFYMYFRFLFATVVGVVCFAISAKKNSQYFWFGIMPGFVGVIASVLVTNMSLEISVARTYIGVMATLFIVGNVIKERFDKVVAVKVAGYIVVCAFIGGLVISKLLLVRVTGCLPVTVKMEMDWVKEGPVAGLLIDDELAAQYNENISMIEQYVDADDNLLYFGCENIYYLVSGANLAAPSVQGTTVFNEIFLKYYEEHPERTPNVVIIDKEFELNPVYNYSEQNNIMKEWIEDEFSNAKVTETTYFIILER